MDDRNIAERPRAVEERNREVPGPSRPRREPGDDLVAYALAHGYALRPRDGNRRIAMLENLALHDRVAVAKEPDGRLVFAGVRDYALRGPDESREDAVERLRKSIFQSRERGGLDEFAQRVERQERQVHPAPALPTPEPIAEQRRVAAGIHPVDAFNLVEYAEGNLGYELRRGDGGGGILVLEHGALGDRVAIAREPDGGWAFAAVRDYAPRGANEPPERALERLRGCIARSPEIGEFLEFQQRAERLALEGRPSALNRRHYGVTLAAAAHPPTPEQIAERRRGFEAANRAFGGAVPTPPLGPVEAPRASVPERRSAMNRRWHDAVATPASSPVTPEQIAERRRAFEELNRALHARSAPRSPAPVQAMRAFSLVEYAQRELGYEVRRGDCGAGIVVLEHGALRDRVAMAQAPDGRWLYVDVRAYAPRAAQEPAEAALGRLRQCIAQSPSRGEPREFAARAMALRQEIGVEFARMQPRADRTPVMLPAAPGAQGADLGAGGGLGTPSMGRGLERGRGR